MSKINENKAISPLKKENIILKANEDTSFKLKLSISNKEYLCFFLKESTALSPYYYSKSFTIDQLYSLNKIFRSCLSLDEAQAHLFTVIDNNKMFINLTNDGEQLEIKLNIMYFCTQYEIKIQIDRFLEEHNMLTDLYDKDKKMLNKIKLTQKKISESGNSYLKNVLNYMFNKYDIPGIEKPEKVNIKKFCANWTKKFNLKNITNVIGLRLKNLTKITWNKNNVNLFYDPKKSNIKCKKIEVPSLYDITEGQDGDFRLEFPVCEKNDYICVLYLMVEGLIYYEYEIILNITVS